LRRDGSVGALHPLPEHPNDTRIALGIQSECPVPMRLDGCCTSGHHQTHGSTPPGPPTPDRFKTLGKAASREHPLACPRRSPMLKISLTPSPFARPACPSWSRATSIRAGLGDGPGAHVTPVAPAGGPRGPHSAVSRRAAGGPPASPGETIGLDFRGYYALEAAFVMHTASMNPTTFDKEEQDIAGLSTTVLSQC
jgi:hypothetical protein